MTRILFPKKWYRKERRGQHMQGCQLPFHKKQKEERETPEKPRPDDKDKCYTPRTYPNSPQEHSRNTPSLNCHETVFRSKVPTLLSGPVRKPRMSLSFFLPLAFWAGSTNTIERTHQSKTPRSPSSLQVGLAMNSDSV